MMSNVDREWYLNRIRTHGFTAESDGFTNQISMLVKFSSLLEVLHQLSPSRVVDLGAGVGLLGKCLPVECEYVAVDALYTSREVRDLVISNVVNANLIASDLETYEDHEVTDGTVYVLSMVSQDIEISTFMKLVRRLCITDRAVKVVILSSYYHDEESDGYKINGEDFDGVLIRLRKDIPALGTVSVKYFDGYGMMVLTPRLKFLREEERVNL